MSTQVLSLIALRLGAPNETQPFLRETASSLPISTSFQASSSSVAINSLWLISLVASLAAALFGMLAKQWCREYLRWHSAVSSAKDNVVVRQARFEAWQRWHVSAYIAWIPILLEVALILFFVGLAIFSWLLNRTVAIVVTCSVGASVGATFAVTIIPVVSRLSPFKSPTGLALARLTDTIRSFFEGSNDTSHVQLRHNETSGATWRERDRIAVLVLGHVHGHAGSRWAAEERQIGLLVKALTWMQHANDDQQIMGNVRECLLSTYGGQVDRALWMSALRSCIGWQSSMSSLEDWIRSRCFTETSTPSFGVGSRFQPPFVVSASPAGLDTQCGPFVLDVAVLDLTSVDPVAVRVVRILLYIQLYYLAKNYEFEDIPLLLAALRCTPFIPLDASPYDTDRFDDVKVARDILRNEDISEWLTVLQYIWFRAANCRLPAYRTADALLMVFQILVWMGYEVHVYRDGQAQYNIGIPFSSAFASLHP